MNKRVWGYCLALIVAVLVGGWNHAQSKPLTATVSANSTVSATLAEAVKLQKTPGQEIAARRVLNQVYFHPAATADQKTQARKALTDLNKTTIFSAKMFDGDNLAYAHTVRAGDTLGNLAKQSGCPVTIIRQINGMTADGVLKAGATVKLLRGPFHAQINKAACTLDVFACGTGGEKTLVYHARVAVGKNNATPEGKFRMAGKVEKATWYPPPSLKAKHPNPMKWGEKGYPLGKDGIFMRLAGAEPATEKCKGYGIHSTNDQSSIGKARSSGCIRVGDKDIRQVYNLLTEGSEVRIVP